MLGVIIKVFLVTVLLIVPIDGCNWCDPVAPLTVLDLLKDDARYDASRSALLTGVTLTNNYEPVPLCLNQHLIGSEPPIDDRFYTEYLSAYFPKVDVVLAFILPTMCADAVCRAVRSIVFLLTYAPWRYFVNDAKNFVFESVHVKIIENELHKLVDTLDRAKVDPVTHLMLSRKQHCAYGYSFIAMPLLRFWKNNNQMDDYFTLVALFNDITIHRLYAAIKNEDYNLAYMINQELQRQINVLQGSRYEQQYTLSSRLFSDLLKLLHQRLWNSVDNDPCAADMLDLQQPMVLYEKFNALECAAQGAQKFLDSFITHYEVNITGKFTHEYHPIVLEETARSFTRLEKELVDNALPIIGRLTLMGYEEQGITQYKTRYTDALFSDEMAHKTNAGWSLKMFNRFGLFTGFLCKDVAALNRELNGALPVTHINADQIEIFDGLGTIFQEHAFGEAFRPTMKAYERAQLCLLKKSLPDFFIECMKFWYVLYSQELKVTGKQHVVGTQDILFSIAYMRYVQQSIVPMLHFYAGPDITYPIETSLLHNKEATRHAQKFVKTFVPQLKSLNGKKTGYVFCSFVDGVGKSTMLGNVQNSMKHGDDIDKYDHVDNSSSQLATVFDYSSDVVIADLPAQVSHFTYKPDGFVYVDCGALCSASELAKIVQYVQKTYVSLSHAFGRLLGQAERWEQYDLKKAEAQNPELSYALTVNLLGKSATNTWISFTYNGEYYLFDSTNLSHIRKRVPLATAPSHGLKNCCPEQMIFSSGVRFPMAYTYFLSDLIKQLKKHKVEQIVMVDFISMYSRSSRENIRVNYVIQQLALLNKEFSLANSFYQDFVHNAHLLALLDVPGSEAKFITTLHQESLLRLSLFDMLFDQATTNIDGVPLMTLTNQLRHRIAGYTKETNSYAYKQAAHKVVTEHNRLFGAYGMAREYVTVQQFNPMDLVYFSKALAILMTEKIVCKPINDLWGKVAAATSVLADTKRYDRSLNSTTVMLDTGLVGEVVGQINDNCRDRQQLLTILRLARARWYAAAANILYSKSSGDYIKVSEKLPVIPLVVLPDGRGTLYFVQPILDMPESLEGVTTPDYSFFGIEKRCLKPEQWRVYNNKLYLHDWSGVVHSHGGVFAYGHELSSEPIERQGFRSAIVSNLYTQFAQAHGADKILVASCLERMMKDKKQSLKNNYERWHAESARNGTAPDSVMIPLAKNKHNKQSLDHAKVYAVAPEQKAGLQLYVRITATLDMYAKDLDADFGLRRNNKNDFIAHVMLLERITLPWLFGFFSSDKLFDAYDDITPICEVD